MATAGRSPRPSVFLSNDSLRDRAHHASADLFAIMCGAKPASIQGRLQAIIDAGHGDQPLKDMKFRCAQCGSRRTVCNGGLKRSRGLMPER